jgi:hypothetical protein
MMLKTRSRVHRLLNLFIFLSARMLCFQVLKVVQREKGSVQELKNLFGCLLGQPQKAMAEGSVHWGNKNRIGHLIRFNKKRTPIFFPNSSLLWG